MSKLPNPEDNTRLLAEAGASSGLLKSDPVAATDADCSKQTDIPECGTAPVSPRNNEMNSETCELLVADDEPAFGDLVCELGRMLNLTTKAVTSGKAFMKAYNHNVEHIVLDLAMPEMDGVELLRFLAEQNCQAKIIMVSGFDFEVIQAAARLAEARGLNIAGSLMKPIRPSDIAKLLTRDHPSKRNRRASAEKLPDAEEVERAIHEGQLRVHYQPKFCLANGWLLGVEGLVRWQHPERGLLGPDQFIDTAIKNGLINDLTTVVFHTAVNDIEAWDRNRIPVPSVSLNFDAVTLQDVDLPDRLFEHLSETGVRPSRFVLEVTETGVIEHLANALDTLTRLRLRGMKLSIDDFGTGHSSIAQLSRFPFSELKIDRSFVDQIDGSGYSHTLVRSLVNFGHDLNLTVVAEGVETYGQLQQLKAMGCDSFQGYLASKPVPASQLKQLTAFPSATAA